MSGQVEEGFTTYNPPTREWEVNSMRNSKSYSIKYGTVNVGRPTYVPRATRVPMEACIVPQKLAGTQTMPTSPTERLLNKANKEKTVQRTLFRRELKKLARRILPSASPINSDGKFKNLDQPREFDFIILDKYTNGAARTDCNRRNLHDVYEWVKRTQANRNWSTVQCEMFQTVLREMQQLNKSGGIVRGSYFEDRLTMLGFHNITVRPSWGNSYTFQLLGPDNMADKKDCPPETAFWKYGKWEQRDCEFSYL
ncbi:hypothetical protein G7046_g2607 [Stylonectria norvegica]|nr:hypothetical protein G7046_g2607 [Stylonectria norvegica]